MKFLTKFFVITRAWSFTMSFVSVSLATAIAAEDGKITFSLYALTLLGSFLVHGAANTLNDYLDLKNKIDSPGSPTALYRPHPVFTNILTRRQLLYFSLTLFFLSLVLGITLAILLSAWLWLLILAGFSIAIFYTAAPRGFKYIALGEAAVFLAFGPILMEGAYCIQRGYLSSRAFWISIPTGIWVALVLFANNLRDVESDLQCGIKTIPCMMSKTSALKAFTIASIIPYAIICILIFANILKPPSLAVFLSLPFTMQLIKDFNLNIPMDADSRASKCALIFGMLLLVTLLF